MVYGLFFKVFTLVFLNLSIFFGLHSNETVLEACLLPAYHPLKPQLDYLFSSSRVILSLDTLKKAGFEFSDPRKFTNLVIAKHPLIPGYIFKLYLDAQRHHKGKPEHYFWMLRVIGAHLVRHEIEVNHLQELLKVPQKWIYKLPKKPSVPNGYMTKNYILVEEDMQLFSDKDNEMLWKSSFVTQDHLKAVYTVLTNVGLSDCAKPDNIPFSVDGRIAFIDTQTHGNDVRYENLTSSLSPDNQIFWKSIIE